jgi:phage terminase large subunit-like protein
MSSAIIQFMDNGQIEVTSSRALRRIKSWDKTFKDTQK